MCCSLCYEYVILVHISLLRTIVMPVPWFESYCVCCCFLLLFFCIMLVVNVLLEDDTELSAAISATICIIKLPVDCFEWLPTTRTSRKLQLYSYTPLLPAVDIGWGLGVPAMCSYGYCTLKHDETMTSHSQFPSVDLYFVPDCWKYSWLIVSRESCQFILMWVPRRRPSTPPSALFN